MLINTVTPITKPKGFDFGDWSSSEWSYESGTVTKGIDQISFYNGSNYTYGLYD